MRHEITIKDLIYFGAVAEAYKMKSAKLVWCWHFPCGCVGNVENPTHKYEDCPNQENLFWSDRFVELGRTIKMGVQQDEVESIKCKVVISDTDSEKLHALVEEAEDILGDVGMEYYDLFMRRLQAEASKTRMSILEEHSYYSIAKDWYLQNNISPLHYEEIKINVCMKYLAEKLLQFLQTKEEAVLEAQWTPFHTEPQELLFSEHVVSLTEGGHVTSENESIKASAP